MGAAIGADQMTGEYATFIIEIFKRLDAIAESMAEIKANPESLDNWKNCDFCWFQIRKICEYLALAIVLAHHRDTGVVDDLSKWNPSDLLKQVEKLNAHPTPVQISTHVTANAEGVRQLEHRAVNPHHFVIASEAKQSRVTKRRAGLPRRFAPRNDDSYLTQFTLTPLAKPIRSKIISQIYGRTNNVLHVGTLDRILSMEMPTYDLGQLERWWDGFERLLRNHALILPQVQQILVCLHERGSNASPQIFLMAGEGEAVFVTENLPEFEIIVE